MNATGASTKPIPGFLQNFIVRIIIGIVVILVPVVVLQALVLGLPVDRLVKNVLLGILTPPVVFWVYSKLVRLTEGRVATELGGPGSLKELGRGVLTGAALSLGVFGLLAVFDIYRVSSVNAWQVVLIPLFGMLASAVVEEVFFRGVLFRMLEEGLGSWFALALSALIFGGLHLLNANATIFGAVAVILSAGVLLPAAFMLTRRLWLPIGIHYIWNFLLSGIFGGVVSGGTQSSGLLQSELVGTELLTGGSFGVEASVVTILLAVILTVLILWQVIKRGNLVRPPWRRTRA